MATYYSDLLADPSANTTFKRGYKAGPGVAHSRMRHSGARVTGTLTTSDTSRMITLPSSYRIWRLELTSDSGPTGAGAIDIGLYESGTDHSGPVIDEDLFATSRAVVGVMDQIDVFDEASTISEIDRGKTVWELAALGAASYAVDPMIQMDLVVTPTTTFNSAAELLLHCWYTAGD